MPSSQLFRTLLIVFCFLTSNLAMGWEDFQPFLKSYLSELGGKTVPADIVRQIWLKKQIRDMYGEEHPLTATPLEDMRRIGINERLLDGQSIIGRVMKLLPIQSWLEDGIQITRKIGPIKTTTNSAPTRTEVRDALNEAFTQAKKEYRQQLHVGDRAYGYPDPKAIFINPPYMEALPDTEAECFALCVRDYIDAMVKSSNSFQDYLAGRALLLDKIKERVDVYIASHPPKSAVHSAGSAADFSSCAPSTCAFLSPEGSPIMGVPAAGAPAALPTAAPAEAPAAPAEVPAR